MRTIAVTGGTGFVGRSLIALAQDQGYSAHALTRRPQPARAGIVWIDGALDRPETLATLVRGADAVIHVAGVVNAPDRAGFDAGNVAGTAAMLIAARASGVERFIQVSSLSAREPELSQYGGSKARAEAAVAASGLDWTIVRPPAIYGPGDRELLDLFKAAKLGVVPLPPRGRLSVIEVSDLARLLLALTGDRHSIGGIVEPDDGSGGWTHEAFGRAIGEAVGKRPLAVHLPRRMLTLAAKADGLIRRKSAKLTSDRVAYFCHPDWTVDRARRPDPALWTPRIETSAGLAATARWYREAGWL